MKKLLQPISNLSMTNYNNHVELISIHRKVLHMHIWVKIKISGKRSGAYLRGGGAGQLVGGGGRRLTRGRRCQSGLKVGIPGSRRRMELLSSSRSPASSRKPCCSIPMEGFGHRRPDPATALHAVVAEGEHGGEEGGGEPLRPRPSPSCSGRIKSMARGRWR